MLRRSWYLHGKLMSASTGLPDVSWLNESAELMNEADWHRLDGGFVALQLLGDALPPATSIEPSDTLLLLFNALHQNVIFPLVSEALADTRWQRELDTYEPDAKVIEVTDSYTVHAQSVAVLVSPLEKKPPTEL